MEESAKKCINHDGNFSALTLGVCDNTLTTLSVCPICAFIFFLRGHGNESCNLIGSLPGQKEKLKLEVFGYR